MENRIVVQLSRLFRARFPYIYITTWEEERAISLIKKISKSEKQRHPANNRWHLLTSAGSPADYNPENKNEPASNIPSGLQPISGHETLRTHNIPHP